MTMTMELSLTVTKTIPAKPEKVFNAWLDPKMLAKFMTPGDTMTVPRAETDPREGGRFEIIMATPEKELPHCGTYLEVTPHSRLVFTWESPHSIDGSTVTLDFRPSDDGATEIELTQVKFASDSAVEGHRKGWTAILEELAKVV